jgi:polysaccharide export outer membrane protein
MAGARPARRALALLLAITGFALAGAGTAAERVAASAPASDAADSYLLQPGDILQVSVWKETDLQAELLVRPDGHVSFALAGDLLAAGRTIEQVRADLETRLKKYIPEAVVTVAMKAANGNRIYVIGKVARPGDFGLMGTLDVVQALSLAGGLTTYADGGDIRILRRNGQQQTALRFDMGDVERGRKLEQNILLRAGDTVVVP